MGYETRIRGAVAIEASGYDQLLYELDTNLSSFCIYSDGLHFLCILCGLSESYKVITFADFCPLGRPEALPHPRTRALARSLSRTA